MVWGTIPATLCCLVPNEPIFGMLREKKPHLAARAVPSPSVGTQIRSVILDGTVDVCWP